HWSFSSVMLKFPTRCLIPLRLAKYNSPVTSLSDEEQRLIMRSMIQYGNLCSEEFALWKLGQIPKGIWAIWVDGIRQNFETEIWRSAWTEISRKYDSYKPFVRFMETLINHAQRAVHKD